MYAVFVFYAKNFFVKYRIIGIILEIYIFFLSMPRITTMVIIMKKKIKKGHI